VFTRGKERKATLTTRFSLAHLTVLSLAPPEVVEVAARTGYQTVGLRLLRVMETTPGYPLMDDKPMMRATKTAMAATGVGVLDIELVRITPEYRSGLARALPGRRRGTWREIRDYVSL
jgi:hypothetical protein